MSAPLVLLAGISSDDAISVLPPTCAFAIAMPPLASRDHPFVSLGHSLASGAGPEMLAFDAGPWRSMWQQGASTCFWSSAPPGGRLVLVPGRGNAGD